MPEWLAPYTARGEFIGIRIDCVVFELDGLRPIGHQAPLHEYDLRFSRFRAEADHRLEALRRDVVGRGRFRMAKALVLWV